MAPPGMAESAALIVDVREPIDFGTIRQQASRSEFPWRGVAARNECIQLEGDLTIRE